MAKMIISKVYEVRFSPIDVLNVTARSMKKAIEYAQAQYMNKHDLFRGDPLLDPQSARYLFDAIVTEEELYAIKG